MSRKNLLLLTAAFALVNVIAVNGVALARGENSGRGGSDDRSAQVATETEQSSDDTNDEATEPTEQEIEQHKTEIKERFEARKQERTEKLETKRLDACNKREAKINQILAQGTDQSRKHLAVFQKIEERVEAFYTDKKLSAEGYDAAVANANAKEATAIAAIESSSELTFDCDTTDGAKPGAVKELMKERHDALKDYRTAIKDLILVVKKAQSTNQTTESSEAQ